MTAEEAIAVVRKRWKRLKIDSAYEIFECEQRIVEFKRKRNTPGPAENRLAWVVTTVGDTGTVEVHIDDHSAKTLSVIR